MYSSDEDAAERKVSSEFSNWEQQDNLLLLWLLASLSESVRIHMVGCVFAYQVWEKIEKFFASQTRARIRQLKTQLCNTKKSGSMTTYLLNVKKVIDQLAVIGSPVSTDEHIEVLLDGLPAEYNSVVTSIISRLDPYSIDEMEALLLAIESRIEKCNQLKVASSNLALPVQANVAQTSTNSSWQGRGSHSQSRGRGGFRGRGRSGHGRGRGDYSGNKPQCQVCGKYGHSAWECYHRFNPHFQRPQQQPHAPQQHPQAYLAVPLSQTPDMSKALVVTPSTVYDPLWYPDSGASHHLTPDASVLSHKLQYDGDDHVQVGNGSGMCRHVGDSVLHSKSAQTSFALKNFLHVPGLTKNLLSVSQFACDHKVFFQFYSNSCFVKSQGTKEILLQGTVKDGLCVS